MPRLGALLFLLLCLLLISCQSLSLNAQENILSWHKLPPVLAESSALVCQGQQFMTLNDSGNPAHLYRIDRAGRLLDDYPLPVSNQDWEALTVDDQAWYVGDIGDNFGNRHKLQIYRIARSRLSDAGEADIETLTFSYPDRPAGKLASYDHDFDAEALVSRNGRLWLFSKSWHSRILRIYSLSPDKAEQQARLEATVHDLPGMITAADYDPRRQTWWLAGYATQKGLHFSPFVVELDQTFTPRRVIHLGTSLQVEGLCIADDGGLWLSAERSLTGSAVLMQLDIGAN